MTILRMLKRWWITRLRSKEWKIWNFPASAQCCAHCATRVYRGTVPVCGKTGLPCFPMEVCDDFNRSRWM